MTKLVVLVLVGCGPLPVVPPPPPPQEPPATVVDFEVHGTSTPSTTAEPPAVQLEQPAHVKLKLGHYRNSRRGIGVTIDLVSAATEDVADIDPAKLRFDGETQVWLLEGQHGTFGRIDYVREGARVMLQITREGRVTVFVPDPDTDRASEAIDVTRDGDAEPL